MKTATNFHEPSSQPVEFGNKLQPLDNTFDKSPPAIAVYEPNAHSFPNSTSTVELKKSGLATNKSSKLGMRPQNCHPMPK